MYKRQAHILMNDVRMGNVMVTRSDIGDGCAHVFDMDLYRYEPEDVYKRQGLKILKLSI